MKLTNFEMEAMVGRLQPYLERVDIIGYAAARNVRKLRDGCGDYVAKRQEIVQKYGHEVLDGEGKPTGEWVVEQGDEGYDAALEVISTIGPIESEVPIYKVPIGKVMGLLSGREILELEFMLDEGGEDA